MAMSGINVVPEVGQLFNEIKLKHTRKFAGFKITAEKKQRVVIDEDLKGDKITTETVEEDKECFDEFKQRVLDCKEPRFLLYDFEFTNPDGRKISKLAFVYWCSDDAPVGKRMVYASTKDSVKKVFQGVGAVFEVSDIEEFDYNEMIKEILKKTKN